MIFRTIVLPAIIVAIVATGCATEEPAPTIEPSAAVEADVDAVPTTGAATPTPSESTPREVSQRGNIVKQLGETAGYTNVDTGVVESEFTVDAITVDPECTAEYIEPPEHGHFVVATITASVSSTFQEYIESFGSFPVTGMPFDIGSFTIIDTNGVVVNSIDSAATYACLPEDELIPSEVGIGQNATGKVVFDSPVEHGTLVYVPWFDQTGWEWTF